MKKLFFTSCFLLLLNDAYAQNTSGKILYTETFRMNIDLGGDVDIRSEGDVNADQIRSMLPKEQHMKKVLYYNADATLYAYDRSKEKESNDMDQSNGNMHMVVHMDAPENVVYMSLKEDKLVEQRDFMGRKFLITSDIEKPKWKMTGNQKTILNYPCQEAVMMKEKDTVTAWFTAAIPVSAGPQGYFGLPGMILEAKQNSQLFLKADAVIAGSGDDKMIVKPREGKKVTKDEFKAIVDKKTKEMQEEGGGNGNVIIKINR